jgi:hypothetical protein
MAAAAIAGGAMSALSALQQGRAGAMAGEYNARVAEQNAVLAIEQGIEEEKLLRASARRTISSARAGFGASNIAIEGSALDFLQESASNAEQDALNIKYQSELKAYSYRTQAAMERFSGENARTASYMGAAGSLLSAGASAGRYLSPKAGN